MEKIVRFVKPIISIDFSDLSSRFLGLKEKIVHLIFRYLPFLNYPHHSERHSIQFENEVDFLFLPEIHSVKKHIYFETTSLIGFCVVATVLFIGFFSILFDVSPLVIIFGLLAFYTLVFVVFKLFVVAEALTVPFVDFSKEEIDAINEKDLPTYTVLVPLLREAEVASQIVKAIASIDYPKKKLDVIIPLEEYDHETIEAIKKANPPKYFKVLIVPNVMPKSKPKQLNVAFKEAKGEYVVIYDAEIIPEPGQLKKAYLTFKKYPHIGAVQTRLDHYNYDQNILTRLFNAEFAFYYDLFLPGLHKLGFPIPLSGHSVHFRKSLLRACGAWDPYNMTEDCDIGMRLCRTNGYRTAVLNSFSEEEATSTLEGWIRQRTRWMKGFMQTSIVHLRHPLRFKNEIGGWKNFCAFFLTVPGTVFINLMNFVFWILLILWFLTESPYIQSIFPTPILYVSVVSFIVGNFIFTYLNLVSMYKRGRFHLVKYMLLSPFYWMLQALATARALLQLIFSPHVWEKTEHGTHISAQK